MALFFRSACTVVIGLAACSKAPSPASDERPGAAALTSATTTSSADDGELRRKIVGRWAVARDWSGAPIPLDLADVVEIRADGTLAESNGTHRDEQRWQLADVRTNAAKLKKLSSDPTLKMESDWLPFTLTSDGAIEFTGTKTRWVRHEEPPKVATTKEMTAFMALLDGKPGASARAAKKFGASPAALKDFAETDYKAVRVARVRTRAADSCYVLLANESYLDVCWRNGKVVSVEPVDRSAEK